jgi:ribosome-interacting GTPase 1
MPANLPPEYYKLKHQLEVARTDDERLPLLEEMLRITPKHKGTDKVRVDLRRRITKLKKGEGKKQAKKGHSYHVPKHGAGQIALIGAPNVGKSQIVASFTNAKPAVSPAPYTTFEPAVGMLDYENIQFQLIDIPPITADFVQPWVFDIVRNADLLLLVLSLASDDILDQIDSVRSALIEANILIVGQIHHRQQDIEETSNSDVDNADSFTAKFTKRALIVANQMDNQDASDRLEILREFYADDFPIYPLSAITGEEIDELRIAIYEQMEILRVYTKSPAEPVDPKDPIVLPINGTVIEAATMLHKDFAENFKYARIWGVNWHDGQTVSRDDVVYDGDVLEFHMH